MLTLILIITIFFLVIKNNNLKNQLFEYKNILIKNGLLDVENKNITIEEEQKPIVQEEAKVEKVIVKEKPKYSDKEIKNSSILIVGSILVVLSALVFLTTTWDVTGDILKAAMLFAMLGVFYGASYIAKKINLNQTYKAFHYITLAYIPITLLSLSIFKLIGDYFSINCEGSTIYLGFCSLLVALIYYLDSKNKNSNFIGILSILFLYASVILFGMKLDFDFPTYIFSIGLVGVIFTILHKLNKFYINESINKAGYNIVIASLILFTFIATVFYMIFDNITTIYVINAIILTYLIFYSCYSSKHMNVFNIAFPLLVMFIFLNISGLTYNTLLREIIMLFSFVVVCSYELIVFKSLKDYTYYELVSASAILYLFTFSGNSIPSYLVLAVLLGITLLYYLNDYKTQKLYYLSALTYLTLLSITNYYDLAILYFGYAILFVIAASMYFKSNPFIYVGYALMFLYTASFDYEILSSSVLLGLFTLLTFVYSIYNKNIFYRIVSYIYLNIFALFVSLYIGMNADLEHLLVIPVCGIFIYLSELLLKERSINVDKVFLYVDYGLSVWVLMLLNNEIIHLLLVIIHTLLLCYYCYIIKEDKKYMYVPFFVAIPFIYYGQMLIYDGFNYMILVSISSLLGLLYMTYKTKDNKYTIFYFVYLLFHGSVFETNKYLLLLLVAICGFINYIQREGKIQDIYKALLYFCALIFTQFLVYDYNLNDISIFVYGLYIVFIVLLSRDIIKKYNNDYKKIEYIGLSIINLLAINNFTSEKDGLVFILFLVFCVIVAYIYKYGPTFLISLIFILFNFIRLTKEFWLALPWWLYILVIGFVLILFAVNNELRDKKDNENNVKLVKKLKDELDL